MSRSLAVFVFAVAVGATFAQQIGNCQLHELTDQAGNCTTCPPGGSGYENCTIEESTYDAYCAGMCLLHRVCVFSATENLPVYIKYYCVSDCSNQEFPECSREANPRVVLYDDMPTGCECEPIDT